MTKDKPNDYQLAGVPGDVVVMIAMFQRAIGSERDSGLAHETDNVILSCRGLAKAVAKDGWPDAPITSMADAREFLLPLIAHISKTHSDVFDQTGFPAVAKERVRSSLAALHELLALTQAAVDPRSFKCRGDEGARAALFELVAPKGKAELADDGWALLTMALADAQEHAERWLAVMTELGYAKDMPTKPN